MTNTASSGRTSDMFIDSPRNEARMRMIALENATSKTNQCSHNFIHLNLPMSDCYSDIQGILLSGHCMQEVLKLNIYFSYIIHVLPSLGGYDKWPSPNGIVGSIHKAVCFPLKKCGKIPLSVFQSFLAFTKKTLPKSHMSYFIKS